MFRIVTHAWRALEHLYRAFSATLAVTEGAGASTCLPGAGVVPTVLGLGRFFFCTRCCFIGASGRGGAACCESNQGNANALKPEDWLDELDGAGVEFTATAWPVL